MPAVRTGRRSILAANTRDLEVPAPAMVTGSELVTVDRWQARAWEQAIAAAYHPEEPPPAVRGWSSAGEGGGPVGYDLVLATPQSLSALGWCFFATDRGVSDDIMRADRDAAHDVAVEFSVTIGSEVPVLVAHQFDSAGQPWLHTHVIVGALTRPERPGWTGPQREREVWVPLNEVTVAGMAERLIFGYHLLLRRSVSPTLRELGLNWQQMAQDGSCEVWGLRPAMLECVSQPAHPLGEIHACQVE
jgi:hypothetical protein